MSGAAWRGLILKCFVSVVVPSPAVRDAIFSPAGPVYGDIHHGQVLVTHDHESSLHPYLCYRTCLQSIAPPFGSWRSTSGTSAVSAIHLRGNSVDACKK